jgi:hypothetical protein
MIVNSFQGFVKKNKIGILDVLDMKTNGSREEKKEEDLYYLCQILTILLLLSTIEKEEKFGLILELYTIGNEKEILTIRQAKDMVEGIAYTSFFFIENLTQQTPPSQLSHLQFFREQMHVLIYGKNMLLPYLMQNAKCSNYDDFIQRMLQASEYGVFVDLGDINE